MSYNLKAPLHLCLDQGGHASRALVFDAAGDVVVRAARAVDTDHPATDRVEQDPEAIVASLRQVAAEAVAALGADAQAIVAAGLATQRSSIVCWDRISGEALSPVISWQDRRAHAWLASFAPHAPEVEAITGLRLSPHYGVSKLRWCLDNIGRVQAAARAGRLVAGPLASFLAFRLLEEHPCVADPANAQRMLLANVARADWDDSLLVLFGVARATLPICVATRHEFGGLRVGARVLPFTILTGDQAAALFTFGAPRSDTLYANLGTGAFVQRVMREPARAPGLLTSVALTDADQVVYTLEGTVNGAGAALTWIARELGLAALEKRLPEWLERTDEPPLFLNGVGGLGAPYWLPNFASRFSGDGEPWQRAVAVAESIVFLLLVNIERMQAIGTAADALIVSGGVTAYDGMCQRLADVSGLTAWRPLEHEATARGLAWLLAGKPSGWSAVVGQRFEPAPNAALKARYVRWRAAMEQAIAPR